MRIDLRPRSFGEQLGLVFSLSAAHFGRLFGIALVLSLPSVLLAHYQKQFDASVHSGQVLMLGLLSVLAGLVLMPIGSAASIKIVAASFTGTRASLADGLATGLRRLLPLLGCSMAVGLLVMLGTLLFVIPGLLVMAAYYVAHCPVVLEECGVGAAMGRSKALTRGHRWTVFWLFVVTTLLIQVVPALGVELLAQLGIEGVGLSVLSTLVLAALAVPSMIAPVVAFFDLRVRKEGLDVTVLTELVDRIGAGLRKQASA